jgi:hypothetical protein
VQAVQHGLVLPDLLLWNSFVTIPLLSDKPPDADPSRTDNILNVSAPVSRDYPALEPSSLIKSEHSGLKKLNLS